MDASVCAIVLAAGKGTRMNAPANCNKVAFQLADKPIIVHTYDMLKAAGLESIIVVIGFAGESVQSALGDNVTYAIQADPQGTGHAVKVAMPCLPSNCHTVISMYGDDSAFYPPSLIKTLLSEHSKEEAVITLVTIHKEDPTGLGRIVRNDQGEFTEIVEEKNATDDQKQIHEINTGLFCFDREFLDQAINEIQPNSVTGELYLTDIIEIAVKNHQKVHAITWKSDDIWYGVNTREQLKEAEMRMNQKNAVK
jgi:bifunctional UDP-N-acetylglucosamine pyrophosphorylase / glucosamine-1-phosphate N-acetyltransferase